MSGILNLQSEIDNQCAVIGALLIKPEEVLPDLRKIITADMFTVEECKAIYQSACDIADRNEPLDCMTITMPLESKFGDINQFAANVMRQTPTANNAAIYARHMLKDVNRRKLDGIIQNVSDSLGHGDTDEIISTLKTELEDFNSVESGDVISALDAANNFADYMNEVMEDPESKFCRSGYKRLDEMLGGGFFNQGLYIIGARPGMGKTTLAINIAEQIVHRHQNVLFVSLEMSCNQIMAKRLSWSTGYNYTAIMNGSISKQLTDKIYEEIGNLSEESLFITERSGMTVSDISAAAHKVDNLKCIILDYVGLIQPKDPDSDRQRYEVMTEISNEMKALAKRMKVPIIALAQLNRENTQNKKDKRPALNNLRDTGALEQDADGVILLHRPNYYEGNQADNEEIELIVAKNRHGNCGTVIMSFTGRNGRIFDTGKAAFTSEEAETTSKEELPF